MKTILSFIIIGTLLLGGSHAAAVHGQISPTIAGFGSGITACGNPYPPVTLVTPNVLSGAQCSQAGIQTALNQGGQILLNCGAAVIPLNSVLQFNPTKDTVLDGGGSTTLDGQNKTRILFKDWHDPKKYPSVTLTIQNIRLMNGLAPASGETSGGAIYAGHPGTRVHIFNATLENNHTSAIHIPDNQGGAVFVHNSYETVIAGSVLRGNSAGSGGAFGGIATGLIVVNSLFENNRAVDDTPDTQVVRGYGGALYLDGVFNSYNPNTANQVFVCGSQFRENQAVRGGGAVSSVVSDGFGTRALIERSTFYHNNASGFPNPAKPGEYQFGQGGAIYHIEDDRVGGSNEDNFDIHHSTFQSNQARIQGGAVWVSVLGRGLVDNSTFYQNTTTAPLNTVGQGGALAIFSGTFDLRNDTLAENHAAYQGGGLFGTGQNITLTNTIFANNTLNVQTLPSTTQWQGFQTNTTMQDGGQNLQYPRFKPGFANVVDTLITANPIIADPLLQSLADNGGPTLTLALKAGSPAIDQGAPRCPSMDQRGYTRQGVCDIGAYEFGGAPFTPTNWLYLPVLGR